MSCLCTLSAYHFIVLLGVLRDHAVNFAVVVNVDHAYLYIRHKGVQGRDEVRASLSGEAGDDINGALLLAMTAARIAGLSLKYTLICAFSLLAHS